MKHWLSSWYWKEVSNELQANYKFSLDDAEKAVGNYRKAILKEGICDIIYHSPVDETAKGIVTGQYLNENN